MALLVVVLSPGPAHGQDPSRDPFDVQWDLHLNEEVSPAFTHDPAWSQIVLSPDGSTLIAGTLNGGVVFLAADPDAEKRIERAFKAEQRGEVVAIDTTYDGQRAAVEYADGYIVVLDKDRTAPMLELNLAVVGPSPDENAVAFKTVGPAENGGPGLGDGQWVFVLGHNVSAYFAGAGDTAYRFVGSDPVVIGPWVYAHPTAPIFGALAPTGRLNIYSYNAQNGIRFEGETDDLVAGDGIEITAIHVALGGRHLAVGLSDGTITRYAVNTEAQLTGGRILVPEYTAQMAGAIEAVILSPEGERIAVLAAQTAEQEPTVLWASGDNIGGTSEQRQATDDGAVRLTFLDVQQMRGSQDLYRLMVRDLGSTHVMNLPESSVAGTSARGRGDEPAVLDNDGATAFLVDGPTLGRYAVRTDVLPAPEARGEQDAGAGSTAEGSTDGVLGLGGAFGAAEAIIAITLVVLVLLPLLIFGGLRLMDGRSDNDPLGPLVEPDDAPFGGLSATVMVGATRAMPAASATTLVPLAGRLVLHEVTAAGGPGGVGLRSASLKVDGSGVVRIECDRGSIGALEQLLLGKPPQGGTVAVDGAASTETPLLFARRVRVGLPDEISLGDTPAAALDRVASALRLPQRVRANRVDKDLAWLPETARQRTMGHLGDFDRWKVRLAIALLARPDVLLLRPQDRAPGAHGLPSPAERTVLLGVARHYDCVVLWVDDRVADEPVDLGWLHRDLAIRDGRIVPRPSTSRAAAAPGPSAPAEGASKGRAKGRRTRRGARDGPGERNAGRRPRRSR